MLWGLSPSSATYVLGKSTSQPVSPSVKWGVIVILTLDHILETKRNTHQVPCP